MDVLTALLVEIAKLDEHWTSKLRADSFDSDRTRNQAVGRVKQLDEVRAIVDELKKKRAADDSFEEIPDGTD